MSYKIHSFHIPVMGLAYTIDSPVRVAQYGIDSVVSIMDDDLIHRMNKFYSEKFQKPFEEISVKVEDFRAKRITNYLNLLDEIVSEKFANFKKELLLKKKQFNDFIEMLPSTSELKLKLEIAIKNGKENLEEIKSILDKYLQPGNIDVNIMTKVDKDNFKNGEQLPITNNDAHAALRGFANSRVNSSVIFSAGMNPRLYSYLESFEAFYPDVKGSFKKKIVLKVSDFRSAMIQGNFLAKKGLWVSEYRIESGLNCGGHAFASEGFLLGPIVEEFKNKKTELQKSTFSLFTKALESKNKTIPAQIPEIKITVQGGVGTAEEHEFLLDYFQVDAVGWGSPFLLVPEATSVDKDTRKMLENAGEKDLYLSNISPLGVPFNTIKGSTNEFYKKKRIEEGKAGSSCPKKYLALSKDLDPEGICTASKKFQDQKLTDLQSRKFTLTEKEFAKAFDEITEKSCLCVGLANATYLELDLPIKGQQQGVVVCPGPNIAYFSQQVSLKEMVQHIYGKIKIADHKNRPNMFIKELQLYVDYFSKQVKNAVEITPQQRKKLEAFKANLFDGISYYKDLFKKTSFFEKNKQKIFEDLEKFETKVAQINI